MMTRPVYLLLLSLSLVACDGGILGTGDGGDPTIIVPDDLNSESSEMTGSDVSDTIDSVSDETGDTDGNDLSPTSDLIEQMLAPNTIDPSNIDPSIVNLSAPLFENNTMVTDRGDALLRIVNTEPSGSDAVVATVQGTDTPFIDLPGLFDNTIAEYISVPANTPIMINVFSSEDARASEFDNPAYQSDVLSLAPGSLTTLIIRGNVSNNDRFNASIEALSTGLIPSSTDADSNTNDLPSVRVIHSAPGLASSGDIDIYWVSTDTLLPNGSADLSLDHPVSTGINYGDVVSDYLTLDAGTYHPVITESGSVSIITMTDSITLDAAAITSVVLIDNTIGDGNSAVKTLVIQDDDYR